MKPYYESGGIMIYHGDCREIWGELGNIDLGIYDPPYLEGDFTWLLNDEFVEPVLRFVVTPGKLRSFDWIRVCRPDWEYCWRGSSRSRGGSACLHIGWEPVLAYGLPLRPLGNDVLNYPIGEVGVIPHPWPKPIALITKIVAHWSNAGQVVLDPMMGSGTTLRAAKNLGRRAIGIEIEERYCEIAARRLDQEVLDLGGAA